MAPSNSSSKQGSSNGPSWASGRTDESFSCAAACQKIQIFLKPLLPSYENRLKTAAIQRTPARNQRQSAHDPPRQALRGLCGEKERGAGQTRRARERRRRLGPQSVHRRLLEKL